MFAHTPRILTETLAIGSSRDAVVHNPTAYKAVVECWIDRGKGLYLNSVVSSAPLFATAELAEQAAARAIEICETSGRFPNMCEPF